MTLEILAAGIIERNELTAILESEREAWGEQVARVLGGPALADRPYLADVARLLIAGVQYLLVRSRKIRVFGGVDEGWDLLKASIGRMARELIAAPR